MNETEAKILIKRYIDNQATDEELQVFHDWLLQHPDEEINRLMNEYDAIFRENFTAGPINTQWLLRLLTRLQKEKETPPQKSADGRIFIFWKFRYAAAALIFLAAGGIYYLGLHPSHKPTKIVARSAPVKNDVAPGGNKATLTLANGTVIVLDSVPNGSLAQQGGTDIKKLRNGQVTYSNRGGTNDDGGGSTNDNSSSTNGGPADKISQRNPGSAILKNTIRTPRGGQYQIVLPDGTKVSLNAASSLSFPVAFTGSERNVELTGEGFFAVSKDKEKPFTISAPNGVRVVVMGTDVNVMAYTDEPETKTTLISGSVKVEQGNRERIIRPGQEAAFNPRTTALRVRDGDTSEALAWSRGFFQFNAAGIPEIMRQLARWYDLDVQYEGAVPDRQITGEASKNITLSRLLEVITLNDIHFTIEGKKITIRP